MSICLVCGKAEHGECQCAEQHDQWLRDSVIEEVAKTVSKYNRVMLFMTSNVKEINKTVKIRKQHRKEIVEAIRRMIAPGKR